MNREGYKRKHKEKDRSRMMKTDIEIAQEAELKPITEVAKSLDMTMDDLEHKEEDAEDAESETEPEA